MALNTLSKRANIQRISLLLDIISVDDVVAWADAEIEASEFPSDELIDLSLGRSKSPTQMASLLASLVTDSAERESLKHVLQDVAQRIRAGSLETGTAIQSIYIYLKTDHANSDLYRTFAGLADDFAKIRDGVGGKRDIVGLRESLLNELDAYAASGENAG